MKRCTTQRNGTAVIIGLDFDNTIVDYDRLFHQVAVERGFVPPATPPQKNAVRDSMRKTGIEDAWTELQGYVYGCRMLDADCYPGVMECLEACHRQGHTCCIVSHKTRTPYRGPAYDLHAAAREFLDHKGFLHESVTGLSPDRVFFELTKADKIARIGNLGCSVFLDDLPEILSDPAFPTGTTTVLFDPSGTQTLPGGKWRVTSWVEFQDLVGRGNIHA